VPSGADLAGWAGVFFASLVLMGFGRLLTVGRTTPEASLIVGWGAAVFLLTFWGVVTPASMRIPAALLSALGLVALVWSRTRLSQEQWLSLWRILVLALPLLAVMASARPSLPDTWLNLLPNAAYIYDHGFFPADARPPAHSFIAGAPYNMQLAAFLAGLVTPDFPASAMIDFNVILLLAAALLLARLAAGEEERAPSWSLVALGLLLVTLLNPGFSPRFHLSGYSETSVTVTLMFAGWFAARALDRLSGGRDAALDFWALALTLTALVNIKQESVALAFGVLVAAGALSLIARNAHTRSLTGLMLAALPALLLYLGWRWYVLSHFALGELKGMPFAEWHIRELPLILWNMLRAVGSRAFLFVVLIVVLAVAVRRLWRREFDVATRLGAMLIGVTVIYNAALLFAYVAHFVGEMGIGAHSYFRYNTHLSLLMMAALVLIARHWQWSKFGGRWHRFVPALLIVVVLLDAFPFLRMLRFDLEVPNLRAFSLAHEAAARIVDKERLLLILPGDNGTLPPTIEGVLRYTAPRRPNVVLDVESEIGAGLARTDYTRAVLSCATSDVAGVPAGNAALLDHVGSEWRVTTIWPYDSVPRGARWSQVLAPKPLCLAR
jgi:hypothetical protein